MKQYLVPMVTKEYQYCQITNVVKYCQIRNASDFKPESAKRFLEKLFYQMPNFKPKFQPWSFYPGRAAEVHLLSKDEGPRDIWHNMNMEVNTRKFNFFESLVVLILHLIHSDTPWQNAADIITKCDSYFKTKCDRSLLQNA